MKSTIKDSIKFLKKWAPEGPWVLTAIQTDKKAIVTSTFFPAREDELAKFLEKYQDVRNLYFHVNKPITALKSKAQKEDIKQAEWLHIDIDPRPGEDLNEERERALGLLTDQRPKGIPEPTVIVFSGGGYQGFWRLKDPFIIDGKLDKAEEFELYNKRLEQVFGGDHCHNVDRIMRLPGSTNIPDEKKKKAGRKPETAICLEFNNKEYDLSEFKKAQLVDNGSSVGDKTGSVGGVTVNVPGNIPRILDLAELDRWHVPDSLKIIIAQGRNPDKPKEGDNSRSAWLFDCLCWLFRLGVPDEIVFSLITDPEWAISESVRESRNYEKYAIRQMTRAKEHIEDPALRMMNEKHAIIGNIGGKCRVIEEVEDDILKRTRITVSSFEDIRNRYSNIMVDVGQDKDGKAIRMPLGKYWLNNPMRRQFDHMRFMPNGDKPGVYNLWNGFSVEPKPTDCSLYLNHLLNNVCSRNKNYYDYLLKWMARAVQDPGSQGEVAVVLRGGKGVGKSIVAKIFGQLFGRHYLHVANPSHLVGNFNAHLRDVLCLFADEAFFAGDKRHESVLKMLVTENSIPIEQKGLDVETYPNFVHLIMAANDQHVIRASGDERRYFVLEVSAEKKQDKGYFAAILEQMEKREGLEGLLFTLQNIDLTDFEVRDVPQTAALQEQKLLSMSIEEEWWYRKLQNGRLMEHHAVWEGEVLCDALTLDFTTYAEKWKITRRGNETSLGRFLNRVCPKLSRTQKRAEVEIVDPNTNRTKIVKKRAYFYNFGTLQACRKDWEELHGREMKWEEIPEKEEELKYENPF